MSAKDQGRKNEGWYPGKYVVKLFDGGKKSKNDIPVATAVAVTEKEDRAQSLPPWNCTTEKAKVALVAMGYALDAASLLADHFPAPFSVANLLINVIQQEMQLASEGAEAFKTFVKEIKKFETKACDPVTGYFVKLKKLRELCDVSAVGVSEKEKEEYLLIYNTVVEHCEQLNGVLKDLVESSQKLRKASYRTMERKVQSARLCLCDFKTSLDESIGDISEIIDLNLKIQEKQEHANRAKATIRCKGFRDTWQSGWNAEVESKQFCNFIVSQLTVDIRDKDAFQALVKRRYPTSITCDNVNDLTRSVEDVDKSLDEIVKQLAQLSFCDTLIENPVLRAFWVDNCYQEAVLSIRFEKDLRAAIIYRRMDNELDCDVTTLMENLSKRAGCTAINQEFNVDYRLINLYCRGFISTTLTDTIRKMTFMSDPDNDSDVTVINLTAEKQLLLIYTNKNIPQNVANASNPALPDDELIGEVVNIYPGNPVVVPSDKQFITVCKLDKEDNEFCDVIIFNHMISSKRMKIIVDDENLKNSHSKESRSFYNRFKTSRVARTAVLTAGGAEGNVQEEKEKVDKTGILIKNPTDFQMICIWTDAIPQRNVTYVPNEQHDLPSKGELQFRFGGPKYLTLLRLKSDGKKYAAVYKYREFKLGSVIELNFDMVCDQTLELVDLTFLKLFESPPPPQPPVPVIVVAPQPIAPPPTVYKTPTKGSQVLLPLDYVCPKCNHPLPLKADGKLYESPLTKKSNGSTPSKYVIQRMECNCFKHLL